MQMYNEYHPYLCWLAQLEGIGRKGIFALLQAAGENSLLSPVCFEETIPDPSASVGVPVGAVGTDGSGVPAGPESENPESAGLRHSSLESAGPEPSIPESAGLRPFRPEPANSESAGLRPLNPASAYAAELMAAARTLYTASESQITFFCGEAFPNTGRSRQVKKLLLESRRKGREPGRIAEELEKAGIRFSCILEQGFPEKLRQIPDPPFGIYYRGGLPENGRPAAAVIGARLASGYGRDQARRFSQKIASRGITVISGMARGIDGIAQRAALDEGGKSFAVLGCGVDICYPDENRDLYDRLLQEGGVISEYPPGTFPKAGLFPQRNRIISGLADLVLVIEARKKSGTLITVDMALEQGREVFALPGRVCDSLSDGCNRLIRQGAAPATCPEDILEFFFGTGEAKVAPARRAFAGTDGEGPGVLLGKTPEENDDDGFIADGREAAGREDESVGTGRSIRPVYAEERRDPLEDSILRILSAGDEMHVDRVLEAVNETVNKTGNETGDEENLENDKVQTDLSRLIPVLMRMKINGILEESLPGYYRRTDAM